jgi:hypothetical protein
VVCCLDWVEEIRSWSVEEKPPCDFLLDQIFSLQEVVPLLLVPWTINDLVGLKIVYAPSMDKKTTSPHPTVVCRKVADVQTKVVADVQTNVVCKLVILVTPYNAPGEL